ncbi:MAG: glutamate formimidoyltransferase [Planctomycetota bacterium]|jgi:glutamate formiminotransferase
MSGGRELLECVPNFSEGRDELRLQRLVQALNSQAAAVLLAREMDADHHRAVLTLAGEGEALIAAVLAAAEIACEEIDLRHHRGVHRRMGAIDVCPFIPIAGTEMSLAIGAARELGQRLAERFDLPVFLYGQACQREERRVLGQIRNLEFENLCQIVGEDPDFEPDFGPKRMHPSAGACAVGARDLLIAYNIRLGDGNLGAARKIAAQVRERDGGLPGVQALGFLLPDSGRAQVSMNLLDYRRCGLLETFDRVQALAREFGAEVEASELIGLAPAAALDEAIAAQIMLPEFDAETQVLERRLAACGLV